MSKLAHSNQKTMDEIEAAARANPVDEPPTMKQTGSVHQLSTGWAVSFDGRETEFFVTESEAKARLRTLKAARP